MILGPSYSLSKLKFTLLSKYDQIHTKIFNANGGEFSRRIKERHEIFWKPANAVKIKNTILTMHDPIEKWKDVEHWQRRLSNKFNSREFAEKHHCQVPELYFRGKQFDDIDFNKLPSHYVIRPTSGHSSKMVLLMKEGVNLFDKKKYSPEKIKEYLTRAINKYPTQEFLFEEFIKNEKGEYVIPDDYKFFTFNGHIACIKIINRVSPNKGYSTYYDENWNMLKPVNTYYPRGPYLQPPDCLERMVKDAKRLSEQYKIFVRIDFYVTDKGPVFGEFTPTPGLGNYFTVYGENLFISYWDKYCKGMV